MPPGGVMAPLPAELGPDAVYAVCRPEDLPFATTETVTPVVGTVGQDRALSALGFGLSIPTHGYNLFVSGVPGSGRTTTVLAEVGAIARTAPVPDDWCYVHNFQDSYRPRAL